MKSFVLATPCFWPMVVQAAKKELPEIIRL